MFMISSYLFKTFPQKKNSHAFKAYFFYGAGGGFEIFVFFHYIKKMYTYFMYV